MYGMRSQILAISLLAGLGLVPTCWAQSQMPERGLDKSTVETRLGAPQRVEGPVGEPPITKWIYADFIVVFEYDHVVHTVKRQPAVEQTGDAVTPSGQTQAPASTSDAAGSVGAANARSGEPEGGISESMPPESTTTQSTGDTLSIPQ